MQITESCLKLEQSRKLEEHYGLCVNMVLHMSQGLHAASYSNTSSLRTHTLQVMSSTFPILACSILH